MKSGDQLESRLQDQPPRSIPPEWREEILRAARSAAATHPTRPASAPLPSPVATWLLNLLWPHPRAWAGLAALWLVVLGLNLAAHESGPRTMASEPIAPVSPQRRELLRQQELLMAELVGPMPRTRHDRPKPAAPRPHSERRSELMKA